MNSLFGGQLWPLVRTFASLRRWLQRRTGVRLKGLGFLLRRLQSDHEFEAGGHRWFVDHRVASVYASLLAGSYLEPGTHEFLQFMATHAPAPFTFVDVGANVGEMVVPMAKSPAVSRVVAFEPHPICIAVCRRNLQINDSRADVFPHVIGDGTVQPYVIDEMNAPLSGIRPDWVSAPGVQTVRLDDVLEGTTPALMLIDVEGAELAVLRGGPNFIGNNRPLIVFEYHDDTRKRFSLDEVRSVLGPGYALYRLRDDGFLDTDLINTYNCVAVHADSSWAALCQQRMQI